MHKCFQHLLHQMGFTALHGSIMSGSHDITRMLIEAGADVNKPCKQVGTGQTASELCSCYTPAACRMLPLVLILQLVSTFEHPCMSACLKCCRHVA